MANMSVKMLLALLCGVSTEFSLIVTVLAVGVLARVFKRALALLTRNEGWKMASI